MFLHAEGGRMPFSLLNGLRIHYKLYGDAGLPLVFIHGYTGDATDWARQIEMFSDEFRILVFDNRGHGQSEAPSDPEGYSVEHMVDDAVQLIEKVGFNKFHLVGHSIGGAVAQEIALRWPGRLLSLTLQSTTDWFGDHDEPGGTLPHRTQEDARIAAERVAKMTEVALVGGWRGLLGWPGSTARLQTISVPTMIIHGDRDASRIIEGSGRLSELIRHAKHVVINGAGHSPQRQRPAEYNDALSAFLHATGNQIAV
jgi:pimeloyl-ACP methyl ester carboxylesterase